MPETFEAEHLLNIEMSERLGVGGPEQAIIRMHQMHASKLLQTFQVHLCLEASHLCMINVATNLVVERMPYPEVQAHKELFVKSIADRHKNLVLLTVVDSFSLVPPEFFIFQFSSSSPVAKEFLKKFNEFKQTNNSNSGTRGGPMLSPPSEQAFSQSDLQAKQAAFATLKYKAPTPHKGLNMWPQQQQQHQPQQQQQHQPQQQQQPQHLLNKYMELLNRCLDEVESFVGRLRKAAINYQELEGWREEKKYGAHGGGIRMMRSQPPPPHQFHSIFQIIKLAFNILPKLTGHIKTPSAPELAHYLFQPLDLIVEASCAVLASNEEPIWQQTVSPLFNIDTMAFFDDCLLSNEADLIKSLGTPWNISSSERNFWLSIVSEVPAYKPVFEDGWSPSDDVMTHLSLPIYPSSTHHLAHSPDYSSLPVSQSSPTIPFPQINKPSTPPIAKLQQPFQPQQVYQPQPQKPHQPQPQPQPQPPQPQPLEVTNQRNSFIQESKLYNAFFESTPTKQSDNLSSGLNSNRSISPSTPTQIYSPTFPPPISNIVQLPHQALKIPSTPQNQNTTSQDDFINSVLSKGSMVYVTTVDRVASNDKELDVGKGEAFEVLESNRLHSKVRAVSGVIGYIPSNILQPLSMISQSQQEEIGVTKPKGLTTMDHLNMEFHQKLSHQPPEAAKKREAAATINDKSTPEEVTVWLSSKGFDESVQETLSSFGGKQLFVIDRRVLDRLFGGDMGGRLYSLVLVQRNKSGYKTMRAKELNAILESRKKKADSVLFNVFKKKEVENDPNSLMTEHL